MSDDKKQKGILKSLSELSFIKKLKSIKHIEIIVVVMFVLILLLICFSGTNKLGFFSSNTKKETTSNVEYVSAVNYANHLEEKLSNLISNIKNTGNVKVMVSLDGSTVLTFATDKTITSNGQTTTTDNKVIFVEKDGVSTPIIINEKMPKINGVVVVSSGANDVNVKLNILQAVQTILNIDSNKIQIFVGN